MSQLPWWTLALALLYKTIVETESSLNTSKGKMSKKASGSKQALDKSSVRVFLVEDEPTTIILTEAMLNQLGYSPVGVATSFEAAMAALKATQVDIVLVDLVLSGTKTGFDVIKELNSMNIPCVLISGSINETTLNQLVELDVYGYLPKPYDQLALSTTIQLALKKFTRMQDRIFEEADAIKSRLLATQAFEQEFGVSEKLYLIRKSPYKKLSSQTVDRFSYHRANQWIIGLSMFLVAVSIAGYIFNVPFLLMFSAHGSAIKINTIICFILFCFSLGVENSYRTSSFLKKASMVSIGTILTLSGLTLIEYFTGMNLGVDEFLFQDNFVNEYNIAGRMAIPTTLSLIFLPVALIVNRFKTFRYKIQTTEILALVSLFFSIVGIFGHLFGQIEFNRVVPYLAQSRVTLVVIMMLSLSVFYLNPKKGIMSIFSNRRVSAKVGRKMLYWVNSLMILISLGIYYFVPQAKLNNLEIILVLIASVTALTLVILWATIKQIRNELHAEQTVKLLENRERELQFVLKRVPHPVAVLDREMRYVLTSRQWLEDFGHKDKNTLGQSINETFPKLSDSILILFQRALGGEIIKVSEAEMSDSFGNKLKIKGEIRPWFNISDQIAGVIVFFESVMVLNRNRVQ